MTLVEKVKDGIGIFSYSNAQIHQNEKKENTKMTMLEQMQQHIPNPYPGMYLDGYTPYEILQATSRKMYHDHQARQEEADNIIIPTIHFKTTVKIK